MTIRFIVLAVMLLIPGIPANLANADDAGHPVTLWEARGANNSVYLLGSIHLLRKADHPLPAVIERAYNDAEVLIMEIDMDDLDPLASQSALNAMGLIQGDTTLEDMMGEKMYQRALDAAAQIDIPLDMLARTEPWFAAMTVEMMALTRIGFDPGLGVEMHMSAKAGVDGKPIEGLETFDEQLGFLDGLSLPAQRKMLLSTLEESAELVEMMDDLILAWRHGDVDFLETEMLESLAEHKELNKVLVTDRNARWVSQIGKLLHDDDDYLVIVGALHLIGDDGVPNLLARKGVPIQQLRERPTLR